MYDSVLFVILLHATIDMMPFIEQLPIRCVLHAECEGFIGSTLRMTTEELHAVSEPDAVNRIVAEDIETLSEVDGLTARGSNHLDRMMGPDRKRAIRAKVGQETARWLAVRFIGARCALRVCEMALHAVILQLVFEPRGAMV